MLVAVQNVAALKLEHVHIK